MASASAPYSWQGGVAFQQELRSGVAVTIGYFRTVGGNFTVTDNILVDRSNYDYFCLNAPSDSQLPGGGGQQICGIHDQRVVNPVSNLVRPASDFGKQTSVFNGVDFTTNARFGNGGFVTGGISIGRTVTDNCDVVANLPEAGAGPGQTGTNTCHVQPSWSASTDFKLSGSYRVRGDVQVSVNYQNSPRHSDARGVERTEFGDRTGAWPEPVCVPRGVDGCTMHRVAWHRTGAHEFVVPRGTLQSARARW
jgi:hypothetical protein